MKCYFNVFTLVFERIKDNSRFKKFVGALGIGRVSLDHLRDYLGS